MPRERTISVRVRKTVDDKGKRCEMIYAKLTYTDHGGKRKTVES